MGRQWSSDSASTSGLTISLCQGFPGPRGEKGDRSERGEKVRRGAWRGGRGAGAAGGRRRLSPVTVATQPLAFRTGRARCPWPERSEGPEGRAGATGPGPAMSCGTCQPRGVSPSSELSPKSRWPQQPCAERHMWATAALLVVTAPCSPRSPRTGPLSLPPQPQAGLAEAGPIPGSWRVVQRGWLSEATADARGGWEASQSQAAQRAQAGVPSP